jgi:hypothetical protein
MVYLKAVIYRGRTAKNYKKFRAISSAKLPEIICGIKMTMIHRAE